MFEKKIQKLKNEEKNPQKKKTGHRGHHRSDNVDQSRNLYTTRTTLAEFIIGLRC